MSIVAIQLTRFGSERDPHAKAVVDVQLSDGSCYRVISECVDGSFSHWVNTRRDDPSPVWQRLSALGGAPEAPSGPSGWRPIAQAPVMASVLVYEPGCGIAICRKWADGRWKDDSGATVHPTFWMPLPDRPVPYDRPAT